MCPEIFDLPPAIGSVFVAPDDQRGHGQARKVPATVPIRHRIERRSRRLVIGLRPEVRQRLEAGMRLALCQPCRRDAPGGLGDAILPQPLSRDIQRLEPVRHRAERPGAIENQPFQPVRDPAGHLLRDHAAHGMTDQYAALYAPCVEVGDDLFGKAADGPGGGALARAPEPWQIQRDDAEPVAERRLDIGPLFRSAQVAMHHHHRQGLGLHAGLCRRIHGCRAAHCICSGSQSAIWGKVTNRPISTTSAAMKGRQPRMTWPMPTCPLLIPWIT